MDRDIKPRQIIFDSTSEVFATDSSGSFNFALSEGGQKVFDTAEYDEIRIVVSLWSPSANVVIDLDRAYAELRAAFDQEEEHWIKLAEIEPIVPPYAAGDSFDGWIVLPVMALRSSFALWGSGFEPRTRLQIRASAYLVA
jgi:hypothetical protein